MRYHGDLDCVRSRGIRICCFCVSFEFIEFVEFFGVRVRDISSGIFLVKSGSRQLVFPVFLRLQPISVLLLLFPSFVFSISSNGRSSLYICCSLFSFFFKPIFHCSFPK